MTILWMFYLLKLHKLERNLLKYISGSESRNQKGIEKGMKENYLEQWIKSWGKKIKYQGNK